MPSAEPCETIEGLKAALAEYAGLYGLTKQAQLLMSRAELEARLHASGLTSITALQAGSTELSGG